MQTKQMIVAFFLFVFILATPCLALAVGGIHIVVKSEITDRNPVVNIWLNEDYKGAIEGRQGIYFHDLEADLYHIKAVTKGFEPFHTDVRVEDDQVIKVRINFLFPEMKSEDVVSTENIEMVKQVGTVIFKSIPLGAFIYLDGKRMGAADKKIANVVAGYHSVGFAFKRKSVGGGFELEPNETLIVKGVLSENRIVKEVSIPGSTEEHDYGQNQVEDEFSIADTHWEGSECNTYGDCWKLKITFNADGFVEIVGGMANRAEWVQNVSDVELFETLNGVKTKVGEFEIKEEKPIRMEGWETMASHKAKLKLIPQEM